MFFFFFFNDTATTEIYTLSLHDALPICRVVNAGQRRHVAHEVREAGEGSEARDAEATDRSEEHTSELQSQSNLVCRLLLEKKKKKIINNQRNYSGSHSCIARSGCACHWK